jgi:phospholipid/cholesterol/gamma-HCH transport system substrate-binding protein
MTDKEPDPVAPPPIAHVEMKAVFLLIFLVTLMSAAALYLLYARGAFESTQTLVLIAEDAEGVVVGMDVTFSGFPIGRVSQIELTKEGKARMIVAVARKDAHWLRQSSIFTMERSLVGATHLRAFSGVLTDPPLEENAVRQVLIGDATAEIPLLMAAAKELVRNLSALTAADSSLDLSLRNVKTVTEKLAGKGGALGVLAGSDENAQKMLMTLDRANTLLVSVDKLVQQADKQVFGQGGAMPEARAAIVQLNGLLTDARTSMKQVDAILQDMKVVGGNVKEASADLGRLRADVESNLQKIDRLVNEINRKWPFKKEVEVKLP